MDEVGGDQLRNERWHNIGKKDDAFRYLGTDKVEGRREDDDIEDIVDQTCETIRYNRHGEWIIATKQPEGYQHIGISPLKDC